MTHAMASIVGRAWRTPLGDSIDTAMARFYAGERAAMADPRGAYACNVIAPIRTEPARSRNARFLRRMGLFGLEVAVEALAASGVGGGVRVGLFSGVGGLRVHWDDMIVPFAEQRDDGERMWERGLAGVHPFWMLRHLSNNVHALASAELDLRGEGATFGGANGGAQAMAAAIRALHDGDGLDAALVVTYDSLLESETLVELGARGQAPDFVPGEAAAAVVLVRDRAGAPRVAARDGAGVGALAHCARTLASPSVGVVDGAARELVTALFEARSVEQTAIAAAMGHVGAATAVVQAIALAEMLRTKPQSHTALGVAIGAPSLASAVRVEVPA